MTKKKTIFFAHNEDLMTNLFYLFIYFIFLYSIKFKHLWKIHEQKVV